APSFDATAAIASVRHGILLSRQASDETATRGRRTHENGSAAFFYSDGRTPTVRRLFQGGDMTTTVLDPISLLSMHDDDELARSLPCRTQDPVLIFAETPHDVEAAKALCLDCPVGQACLAGGLDRGEHWS